MNVSPDEHDRDLETFDKMNWSSAEAATVVSARGLVRDLEGAEMRKTLPFAMRRVGKGTRMK